jgi:UDP-N-acetylglucosamine--dolichyl-phosphate N-acetylglucosaminephosphotransferase
VANQGAIEYSRASLEKLHPLGHLVIAILEPFGLVTVTRDSKGQLKEMNNMTVINLLLTKTGPIREEDAVKYLLLGQLSCNLFALAVKEWLASLWY